MTWRALSINPYVEVLPQTITNSNFEFKAWTRGLHSSTFQLNLSWGLLVYFSAQSEPSL
jgi:hypothetical protein